MHRNTNDQCEIPKTAGASHAGLVRATAFKAERACRAQRNALSLKHGLLRDKRQPPDGSSSRANCGKRKVERLPDMPSAMRSGSDLSMHRSWPIMSAMEGSSINFTVFAIDGGPTNLAVACAARNSGI
mmetsp:Transcript_55829/g.154647  ORF Transcript_55829/g.154647 Transcript_55829/m.154647 type:complete len:128 (+) Transcript_55829:238-621(+)